MSRLPLAPDRESRESVAVLSVPDRHCANCGASAPDNYCPACGQNTRERLPTFAQFMREATGRYLSFEGKLWKTLFPLLFRPGFLTRAYFAGRRKRYIGPARLFLVSSLVLFAVLRLVSESLEFTDLVQIDSPTPAPGAPVEKKWASKAAMKAAAEDGTKSAPKSAAKDGAAAVPKDTAKDAANELAKDIAKETGDGLIVLDEDLNFSLGDLPESMGPLKKRLDRFNHLSRAQKFDQILAGALRYGPYAMFALLPAFAALLKVVYLGRKRRHPNRPRLYGEHLVFAAHNHAFLFIVGTLMLLLPEPARPFGACWMFFYLIASTRKVYGGSWLGIAARGLVLFIIYTILFSVVTMGLLVVAVLLR